MKENSGFHRLPRNAAISNSNIDLSPTDRSSLRKLRIFHVLKRVNNGTTVWWNDKTTLSKDPWKSRILSLFISQNWLLLTKKINIMRIFKDFFYIHNCVTHISCTYLPSCLLVWLRIFSLSFFLFGIENIYFKIF